MADKLIRVCDVAHEEELLAERRTFGLDGVDYEVDLCEEDNEALNEAIRVYIEHARRVGRGRPVPTRKRSTLQQVPDESKRDLAAVRSWAKEQGLPVSSRGRVPADVIDQYDAAHGWQKIA